MPEELEKYICPECGYKQDEPGVCPECGDIELIPESELEEGDWKEDWEEEEEEI